MSWLQVQGLQGKLRNARCSQHNPMGGVPTTSGEAETKDFKRGISHVLPEYLRTFCRSVLSTSWWGSLCGVEKLEMNPMGGLQLSVSQSRLLDPWGKSVFYMLPVQDSPPGLAGRNYLYGPDRHAFRPGSSCIPARIVMHSGPDRRCPSCPASHGLPARQVMVSGVDVSTSGLDCWALSCHITTHFM